MNPKTKYSILVFVAVLLLSPLALQAQGEISLESLASRITVLQSGHNRQERALSQQLDRIRKLEAEVRSLKNSTATQKPTATARATATPKPTATKWSNFRATATPRPDCNLPGIPEPPPPAQRIDCEAWGVTYQLVSLAAAGASIDGMLPRVLREFYPLVVRAARNCGVSATNLGDLVYVGAQQMERMGKPSQGNAIGYLLGGMADSAFVDVMKEAGGCSEAVVLVIWAAE